MLTLSFLVAQVPQILDHKPGQPRHLKADARRADRRGRSSAVKAKRTLEVQTRQSRQAFEVLYPLEVVLLQVENFELEVRGQLLADALEPATVAMEGDDS